MAGPVTLGFSVARETSLVAWVAVTILGAPVSAQLSGRFTGPTSSQPLALTASDEFLARGRIPTTTP